MIRCWTHYCSLLVFGCPYSYCFNAVSSHDFDFQTLNLCALAYQRTHTHTVYTSCRLADQHRTPPLRSVLMIAVSKISNRGSQNPRTVGYVHFEMPSESSNLQGAGPIFRAGPIVPDWFFEHWPYLCDRRHIFTASLKQTTATICQRRSKYPQLCYAAPYHQEGARNKQDMKTRKGTYQTI